VIIDFHTHIFPPRIKENPAAFIERDPCFAEIYSSTKAKLATAEDLISSMDKDNVDISVVLNYGWTSQEMCVETNDYILEAVSCYSDRLVGFCTVQLKAGEAAIAEIERCARNGASGIGEVRPDIQGFDLGDEETMRPIVEVAEKHNLIFLTHASEPVGHLYPGKGNITPDILYRFSTNFPELRIVLAHWGGGLPFYALMPEVASALKNTFFDTAASPLLYSHHIFERVTQIVGAEKILFGTDNPLIAPSRIIAQIESAELPQEGKEKILGGNAQRLLEWRKSAASSL
jgi:predicted TIM-barrel fold metal-dependent hydrolase